MTWESSAITITTLLPILGALVILLVPKDRERMVRGLGILFTGAALVFSIAIAIGFDYGKSGLQYELDVNWISAIGARFHVGIDGISMPLYVLTFLLSFLCAVYTWRFADPQIPIRKYIGTSTISQNTKNRIRSKAMNVPAIPVSSRSINARNALVRPGSGTNRHV